MDALATLGSLLGLAFVSGVRLYSTVLAVGLGIRFGFIGIPPHLSALQHLAETPILVVAGVLYGIEFLADKIPWVDSAWDLVHTFIRPLGAAILAATAIGPVDPTVRTAVLLASGIVALSGHSAKAGTRLLANTSPEPVSNIVLSVVEDAGVAGGVWLALKHPLVALALVLICVGLIVWLLPKIIRLCRQGLRKIVDFLRTSLGQKGEDRNAT